MSNGIKSCVFTENFSETIIFISFCQTINHYKKYNKHLIRDHFPSYLPFRIHRITLNITTMDRGRRRSNSTRTGTGRLRQWPRILKRPNTILELILIVGKDRPHRLHPRLPIINPQISPVQQITQSLRPIPLYDPLPARQSRKVIHVLGQLTYGVLQGDEAPIHYVDAVGHGVGDVLLHETPETRQVRCYAGDAHDGALGGGVAPGLVVAGEDAQVATADEFFVVEPKEGVCGT